MIDEADEDGSGSVNFQEFVQLMLMRQAGGITREEIKQVGFINAVCHHSLQVKVAYLHCFSAVV